MTFRFKIISALLLFCCFLMPSCNSSGQLSVKKHENSKSEIEPNQDSLKVVEVGWEENFEKLPELNFESISEQEFKTLKSKEYYKNIKLEEKGDLFFLQTVKNKHSFKKYMDYGGEESWNGQEFLGYNPSLKLFALTDNSTAESMGFSELFFLDSITDYKYRIISFGDGSVSLPLPSINNKYLVYYENSMYKHQNCEIGVLKINSKIDPKNYLKEFSSHHSDNFAVEEIIWKSDNCFYVKGYQEKYDGTNWIKEFSYYKTDIM